MSQAVVLVVTIVGPLTQMPIAFTENDEIVEVYPGQIRCVVTFQRHEPDGTSSNISALCGPSHAFVGRDFELPQKSRRNSLGYSALGSGVGCAR
jgi:hypothetical protein